MNIDLVLKDIARHGVMAPSADNKLEYFFEFIGSSATICIRPGSDFSPTLPRHKRVLSLLAFGAIVENMLLRATELGFVGESSWLPCDDLSIIARVCFSKNIEISPDPLATAIPFRQTNRQIFFRGAPTSMQKDLLAAEVQKHAGTRLLWLEGDKRWRALKLIWLAESERFCSIRLHEELFSTIRFDLGWKDTCDQGLPPAALEVESVMRPMFKAIRHWPLMRCLSAVGVHRLLGLRAGFLPAWQAPALGIVLTSLPIEEGAVAAGRSFERLWLRATIDRLVLQPMAASAVLSLQEDTDLYSSKKCRNSLRSEWADLFPGEWPAMVFRMGGMLKTDLPSVKTGRRLLSSYER
ncbi:hypothetical protein LNV09_15100 [Paucibacter sp. B2R-40]|uniref:hypothetical protein n=1 Tax=Paucibacter sp. B2R-40 TaxID=2893554 RepID=UPI0021E4F044|nr:hypothetical protein [Paucibacter sp. B2R-40]MCV2355476.1 hypothetical protein [Paucibacter sp. B2R-40]